VWQHADISVLPYALVLGVVIHIAGDMITRGGCPLGWPWSQTMHGLKWFLTGSRTEKRIVAPLLFVLLIAAVIGHLSPVIRTQADTISNWASNRQ
jgi:membrane-bound metal-dependent hydrolase YbcI (DUF457 family)